METIKLGMTSKKVLNIIRENNTESESETVKDVHVGMTGNEFRKALNSDLSVWAGDENYPEITNKSSDEVVRERFNTAANGGVEPTENATVTITVSGVKDGDEPTGTIGNEAITEFPAEITRVVGTTETLEITCEGYETYTQEITFNEDKSVEAVLAKESDDNEQ